MNLTEQPAPISNDSSVTGQKRPRAEDDDSGGLAALIPATPLPTGSDAELHAAIDNLKASFVRNLRAKASRLRLGAPSVLAQALSHTGALSPSAEGEESSSSGNVPSIVLRNVDDDTVPNAVGHIQDVVRARLRVTALISIAQGLVDERNQLMHMKNAILKANQRADEIATLPPE